MTALLPCLCPPRFVSQSHRRRPTAPGQVMVLLAVLLALLVVPLGLVILEVRVQTDTYRQVQRVVQRAAFDAAGMLNDSALAQGAVQVDQPAAQARADRTLRLGLAGYGQRVSAAHALLTLSAGTPPTVCYAADVTIGVLVHTGMGWTYHLTACARSVIPGP